MTTIGDYAFAKADIESIRIPSSATTVGSYVFKQSTLETVIFGVGLTTIDEGMFYECTSLANVKFETNSKTYKYVYVSNNVFKEYINNELTGKYISGGLDKTAGTEDDISIEYVLCYDDKFYITNKNGTFLSVGKDQLLGTADDQLFAIGNDGIPFNEDDFDLKLINGSYYKVYENNTYELVTIAYGLDVVQYQISNDRVCLKDGQLVDVAITTEGVCYLAYANDAGLDLRIEAGKDKLLGTADDQLKIYGTGLEGVDVYEYVETLEDESTVKSYYIDYHDNTYQLITKTSSGFDIGRLICGGLDATLNTDDDNVLEDLVYTYYDLYDDGINVGRAQTATMEYFAIKTIVIDGVTCHYLQTVQGEFQNRTSYLIYGKDQLLGTADDMLVNDLSKLVLPAEPVEEVYVPVDDVIKDTYIYNVSDIYGEDKSVKNLMTNSFTTIEDYAFYGCTALTEIHMSNNLDSIGEKAFYGAGLKNVTIPESVTVIGEFAFAFMPALKEAQVKTTVNSVSMFESDKLLEKVSLAFNTQKISKRMFADCVKIHTINFVTSFIHDVHINLPGGNFDNGDTPEAGQNPDSDDPDPTVKVLPNSVLFQLAGYLALNEGIEEKQSWDEYYVASEVISLLVSFSYVSICFIISIVSCLSL